MSAAPRAVKVTFGDHRLVVPIGGPIDVPVRALIRKISARLAADGANEQADSDDINDEIDDFEVINDKTESLTDANESASCSRESKTLRLARLETADGFVLNPDDLIAEVIHDGEHLVAVGYHSWLQSELPHCLARAPALQLVKEDFADVKPNCGAKFVTVGVSPRNRLFVLFGTGYGASNATAKVTRLELFDAEAVAAAQPGTKIGEVGGAVSNTADGKTKDGRWAAKAEFVAGSGGAKVAVQLSIKTASASAWTSKKIDVAVKGDVLVFGSITAVADPDNEKLPAFAPLPSAERTGPVLIPVDENSSATVSEDPRRPPKEGANVAKGNIPLKIAQSHHVLVEFLQTMPWSQERIFHNTIMSNFIVENSGGPEEVAIKDVLCEYQAADGSWIAAAPGSDEGNTLVGARHAHHHYQWQDEGDRRFSIRKNSREEVAVGLRLVLTIGPNSHVNDSNAFRRLHHSLPSPLRIRTTFTDTEGRTSTIETVAENPPLDLDTPATLIAKRSDDGKRELLFFCFADDCDVETRIVGTVFSSDTSRKFLIVSTGGNQSLYIYRSTLAKYEYLARRENKSEILIKDLTREQSSSTRGTMSAHVTAVIDADSGRCSAFKFDLKTNTSHTVEYYPLPELARE